MPPFFRQLFYTKNPTGNAFIVQIYNNILIEKTFAPAFSTKSLFR